MTKRGADDLGQGGLSKKLHTEEDSELIVYSPCVVPPELKSRVNSLVEVLLPPKYLVADHKQVKLRQLWGTDTYTDDSDLVAVLVHTGHVKLKASAPKMPLLISLRVCPTTSTYAGSDRNGVSSRDWSGAPHAGVSYKVERCLQHTGEVPPPEMSGLLPSLTTRQIPGSLVQVPPGPGKSFAIPPAACLVVFSLSSEPWLKYSLALVADQGTDKDRWTSTRLRRDALYLESATDRYELSLAQGASSGYDQYTLSKVKGPHEMDARAVEAAGARRFFSDGSGFVMSDRGCTHTWRHNGTSRGLSARVASNPRPTAPVPPCLTCLPLGLCVQACRFPKGRPPCSRRGLTGRSWCGGRAMCVCAATSTRSSACSTCLTRSPRELWRARARAAAAAAEVFTVFAPLGRGGPCGET